MGSVAGNVGHAPTSDLATRVTFAVPPLAAAGALFVGLVILKAVMSRPAQPESVATVAAREVAIARSGERGYSAALAAIARTRKADKERTERADKERTRRPPGKARHPVSVRRPRQSKVTAKEEAMAALLAEPDMPADELSGRFGVSGRTGRRWREKARELATSAADGNGG